MIYAFCAASEEKKTHFRWKPTGWGHKRWQCYISKAHLVVWSLTTLGIAHLLLLNRSPTWIYDKQTTWWACTAKRPATEDLIVHAKIAKRSVRFAQRSDPSHFSGYKGHPSGWKRQGRGRRVPMLGSGPWGKIPFIFHFNDHRRDGDEK